MCKPEGVPIHNDKKVQKILTINMSNSNFENSKEQIAITPSAEIPDPNNETIQDIEYYKEKAEKLESELHKSKIQINKLEATITKLQSTLSSYTLFIIFTNSSSFEYVFINSLSGIYSFNNSNPYK